MVNMEKEQKRARVIIGSTIMVALFLLFFALALTSEASVLYQPTATSTVTNVNYQVYDQNYFNWSIPCDSLSAESISKVTAFGQGSSASGKLKMTLNGTWSTENNFTTSYSQQVFTFSPAIDCQNGFFNFGLFEYNWGSYSGIWLQEIARVQGCPLPPAYSNVGLSQRSGALDEYRGCPTWIIEGTASVAATDEPTAATSTDPAATVQFSFFSLWTILLIAFLTYAVINKK